MPSIDLLSRTAGADEDGVDHIGYETPRSGVATPQPDLQDKRLPGIMSYFGQVRQDTPLAPQTSYATSDHEVATLPHHMAAAKTHHGSSTTSLPLRYPSEGALPSSHSLSCCDPGQHHCSQRQDSVGSAQEAPSHLYPPTPPVSQPPSSGGSFRVERPEATNQETNAPSEVAPADSSSLSPRLPEPSDETSSSSSPSSSKAPPSSHAPIPTSDPTSASVSDPTSVSTLAPTSAPTPAPTSETECHTGTEEKPVPPVFSGGGGGKWFSLGGLKGLTRVFKSGPSTPTRALSTAQSSYSDSRDNSKRASNDGVETSGTQTPRVPAGAQAPTPKGKLSIRITEGRGLRKCRDPYVVVVFQRSELISGGPRQFDDGENLNIPPPPGRGGIAIQRQGSDSGRPPMSIPMRSRQSSNTSTSEHSSFRNRPARLSFTNPKWDSEAVLYAAPAPMLNCNLKFTLSPILPMLTPPQ